jgi:hypothetical protein
LKPPNSQRPFPLAKLVQTVSAILVVAALAAGVGLRVARFNSVPLGFDQDEACDGYDAYSILLTGRDHHGNFLPLVMQGFNDYRMPLFQYSLVPLVAALGLKPWVVRLGAALWGIADLFALTMLAGLMLGLPGAAAAALFGALSPWHLAFSRYGIELTAASATVSLAMLFFFMWLRSPKSIWIFASALFFGLSLYTYSVTKVFTPLMIALLAILYWREIRLIGGTAIIALAIVLAIAAPQGVTILRDSAEMQAQFNHLSIFHYMSTCPNCDPLHSHAQSLPAQISNFIANWISYFTPSFLFLTGDRGDHWSMLHPPGFGQLLPEQAPLILIALLALLDTRRRKLTIVAIGWLILAALPAALIVPLGAWMPEARATPTPLSLLDHPLFNVPLTPSLLLAHPDSRHDALAMVPWVMLSAIGFAALLDFTPRLHIVGSAIAGLLIAGSIFHGVGFARFYFGRYPILAAPYFQYGMREAVHDVNNLGSGAEPAIFSQLINQPYIYVLFFDHYPPALFQRERRLQMPALFAPVEHFDRYWFVDPSLAYSRLDHGIFVFRAVDTTPVDPASVVRYPDGRIAYKIVVK